MLTLDITGITWLFCALSGVNALFLGGGWFPLLSLLTVGSNPAQLIRVFRANPEVIVVKLNSPGVVSSRTDLRTSLLFIFKCHLIWGSLVPVSGPGPAAN